MITPGLYRLVNPYGEKYPFNDPGDWDESKDYYLEINAIDPAGVYIPHWQEVGVDWGYGYIKMSSVAGRNIANGSTVEEQKSEGNCGKFVNGVITFPTNSLLIALPTYPTSNPGAFYEANENNWFQLILPGVVLADYSAKIKYTGRFTDIDGDDHAVAEVTLGSDVAYAKVALVSGNGYGDAIDGIIDGSIESEQVDASGSVELPCATSGFYTYVVVSYDKEDEAQEIDYEVFMYLTSSTVATPITDFCGDFIMTGNRLFAWQPGNANMPVTIELGDEPNTLVITGIDYAEEVIANYNPVNGTFSIGYQFLENYIEEDGEEYEMEFLTFANGNYSETALLTFVLSSDGNIVISLASEATGYMLYGENIEDEEDAGWFDGYRNLVFTPETKSGASLKRMPATSSKVRIKSKKDFDQASIIRKVEERVDNGNYMIQRKESFQKTFKDSNKVPVF